MSDNPFAAPETQVNTNVNINNGMLQGTNHLIKDTTTATFQTDVLEQSKKQPVLVDFWAPWCGPCKQLGPVLEKVVHEAQGTVKLVKMNIEDHPVIAGQLGIKSIPAVIAFVDGTPVDGFMGVQSETEIKSFVNKLNNNEKEAAITEAIDAANELFKAGDIVQAGDIYSQVLEHAPQTVTAIAGFANCLLEAGERDQAKALLSTTPENKKQDPLIRGLEAKIALSEQISTLGDPILLAKQVENNPKDYKARFDLSLIYNAQGERDLAASELLFIMGADRSWNDDGARKQLLQFFEAWGPMDPASLSARRRLSSLLFS